MSLKINVLLPKPRDAHETDLLQAAEIELANAAARIQAITGISVIVHKDENEYEREKNPLWMREVSAYEPPKTEEKAPGSSAVTLEDRPPVVAGYESERSHISTSSANFLRGPGLSG